MAHWENPNNVDLKWKVSEEVVQLFDTQLF